MERVESEAFSPLDRIGQLQLRNLDILDSRDKLGVYARIGVLPAGTSAAGLLESSQRDKGE
jgi:argininosuccinate synthase